MKRYLIFKIISLIVSSFLVLSCGPQNRSTTDSIDSGNVDLILTNGKVLTVDHEFSIQNTVVVDNGIIVETGGAELALKYQSDEIVDLGGKVVMPGFNDSHTHIRGRPQRYIELGNVTSILEIQELIRNKIEEIGEGEWITGYGWSEDELDEGRRPLREDIDVAAPNNPVILTRAGGHSAVSTAWHLDLPT